MIKAVICDLDNLLADTEKHHMAAYQEVLKDVGIEISDKQYQDHWIRDGLAIVDFVAKHNLPFNPKELHKRKEVIYKKLVNDYGREMPGATSFLNRLKGIKPLGLATSSYRHNAQVVLDKLNFNDYFDVTVTRTEITKVKPDPEIFLLAAKLLNVEPDECLVLEDAQKGIVAASSAGMKSIAIPDDYTMDNDFSRATMILDSLDDVTLELIESL